MTGPEHYRHAEQLLDRASEEDYGTDAERYLISKAQVHATLALAAASALGRYGHMPVWDADAWQELAGTEPVVGVPAETDGAP